MIELATEPKILNGIWKVRTYGGGLIISLEDAKARNLKEPK